MYTYIYFYVGVCMCVYVYMYVYTSYVYVFLYKYICRSAHNLLKCVFNLHQRLRTPLFLHRFSKFSLL